MAVSPQERTRKARETFNSKFTSENEKSEYFAELARRRQGGIYLRPEEVDALGSAYDVLRTAAERARRKGARDA